MPTIKTGRVLVAAATNVIGKIKSELIEYCYEFDGTNKFQQGQCAKFTVVDPPTIAGCSHEAKTAGPCYPPVEKEAKTNPEVK